MSNASILKLVSLNLALTGIAWGEPYNPNFLVNAGFGFFSTGKKVVEVSEWINVSKSTGWYFGRKDWALWVGFDQGYYLSAPDQVDYFELQLATIPAGVSAGMVKNEHGPHEWKGSLWVSLPFIINFTGAIGFETFEGGERSKVEIGGFIKVPIFACCGVLGMP